MLIKLQHEGSIQSRWKTLALHLFNIKVACSLCKGKRSRSWWTGETESQILGGAGEGEKAAEGKEAAGSVDRKAVSFAYKVIQVLCIKTRKKSILICLYFASEFSQSSPLTASISANLYSSVPTHHFFFQLRSGYEWWLGWKRQGSWMNDGSVSIILLLAAEAMLQLATGLSCWLMLSTATKKRVSFERDLTMYMMTPCVVSRIPSKYTHVS
ncbi:uncharacterized protein MYCFIDRAFT_174114 [Pseudocercospora fijiensis CIRAD86]|uniref:Uncharacterized protein n=1 Tax=Pseudocercospora fijiensis (strain CIRAD86) TaxID=383855 RepID=M3AZB4_PSEFD|nr:uncharacterized protein MYCFIDRAFT_174114 [Pseudocercospora fijiensis CIRAD86]EME82547.1 hypothetical protein MYCFIDRAFT_174114 [Pseudocercospora fijiensis CIRAD86]